MVIKAKTHQKIHWSQSMWEWVCENLSLCVCVCVCVCVRLIPQHQLVTNLRNLNLKLGINHRLYDQLLLNIEILPCAALFRDWSDFYIFFLKSRLSQVSHVLWCDFFHHWFCGSNFRNWILVRCLLFYFFLKKIVYNFFKYHCVQQV